MTDQLPASVGAFFKERKSMLLDVVPQGMDRERMYRILLNAVLKTPSLATADAKSTMLACVTAMQLGLEPGVFNQGWLIPYYNKDMVCKETVFIVGYGGLLDLAMRSGALRAVHVELVRRDDHFKFQRGADYKHGFMLEHPYDPFADPEDRGHVVGAYCMVDLTTGGRQAALMSRAELDAIKAMSRAKNGPWKTHEPEQQKKTVLRRAMKLVKLSPEDMHRLQKLDEQEFEFVKQASPIVDVDLGTITEVTEEGEKDAILEQEHRESESSEAVG